jgi:hypothetical protein
MNRLLLAGLGSALLLAASNANAVVCAAGVVRAGCVGPNGAAVVHRPPAVVHPTHRCHYYYVNGIRHCRRY